MEATPNWRATNDTGNKARGTPPHAGSTKIFFGLRPKLTRHNARQHDGAVAQVIGALAARFLCYVRARVRAQQYGTLSHDTFAWAFFVSEVHGGMMG